MPFTKELTAQDELRIIEKISDEIVKRRLETMAIMFLETAKPLSFVGSQLAITFVGPFLGLFGNIGVDYIMFFNKHENVEKLLKRIEEKIKILDEEEKKAKQQSKSVSATYGIKLDLTPGYEHLPDIGGGDREKGVIAFGRTTSDDPSRAAIIFGEQSVEPSSLLDILSAKVAGEDVLKAANLNDLTLGESKPTERMKIAGHKAVMISQTWSSSGGQNGLVEYYGVWCEKTKRYFTLVFRSGSLKGDKTDRDTLRKMRSAFGGFKCH
jgi:hypothetical protein